jgi:hypothetical protein
LICHEAIDVPRALRHEQRSVPFFPGDCHRGAFHFPGVVAATVLPVLLPAANGGRASVTRLILSDVHPCTFIPAKHLSFQDNVSPPDGFATLMLTATTTKVD